MNRTCPHCHSANVRRSSTPAEEVKWRNHFLSRYRCRECLAKFSVISRRTYIVSATVLGAVLAAAIFVLVLELLLKPSAPKRKRADAVPLVQPRAALDTPASFDTLRILRS